VEPIPVSLRGIVRKPGARYRPGPYSHEPGRSWCRLYLRQAPDVFKDARWRKHNGPRCRPKGGLWRTDIFQRLYFIRQLGFADKVFLDTDDDGNETTN
jgi:hypothetical protein